MVIGFIGFALVAGIGLYFWYRSQVEAELWRYHSAVCGAERVTTQLPLPRRKPTAWDYSRGIPPWNTALMLASGFDPRTYRPQPGDSDLV